MNIKGAGIKCRGIDCPIDRRLTCARHRNWWDAEIAFDALSNPANPAHCYNHVPVRKSRVAETCSCATSGHWVLMVAADGAYAHCSQCKRDATPALESFSVATDDREL